jgi:hypothetical protein
MVPWKASDRGHGPAAGHYSVAHRRDRPAISPAAHRRADNTAIVGRKNKEATAARSAQQVEKKGACGDPKMPFVRTETGVAGGFLGK